MAKFKRTRDGDGKLYGIRFNCPGCLEPHGIPTSDGDSPHIRGRGWQFNGDLERPTLSPSILVHGHQDGSPEYGIRKTPRCHSYVKDGRIRFLDDCEHELRGQTVELPEIEIT
jgi:Family of unknown function (DUF6527)